MMNFNKITTTWQDEKEVILKTNFQKTLIMGSMKHGFIVFALLVWLTPSFGAAAQVSDEIVIEMIGSEDKQPLVTSVAIWKKSAKQLTRIFRGKDKNYVLQAADSIPFLDLPLTNSSGKDYNLVQYGEDTRSYRKMLFESHDNQAFITCASSPSDVIAVFQRYGVNMGLRKADFLATYTQLEKPKTLANGEQVLTVYTVPAEQLPLKSTQEMFAVFEQNKLIKLLNGSTALTSYKKTLAPAPVEKKQESSKPVPAKKPRKPYKALLSGGTVEDRMYMPQVVSGPFTPSSNSNKTAGK